MISQSHYSPNVALTLVVRDRKLASSHVAPINVTVRDACDPIGPTEAELIITADDESESYRVYLPDGIPNAPQNVTYRQYAVSHRETAI
jgi:hypothetical protein